MKLKQISVAIENSPNRLYEVTNALGKAGINLRALNMADTGDFGQLRLLVSDIAKSRKIMMEMHMPARVDEVVTVEIADNPGELAKLLKIFLDTNVYVIYSYAFCGMSSNKAVMVFRFNDNDKAIDLLRKNGFKILDEQSFGMLDTK